MDSMYTHVLYMNNYLPCKKKSCWDLGNVSLVPFWKTALHSFSLSKHLNHFASALETHIGSKRSNFPTVLIYPWVDHLMFLWLPTLVIQSMNYTRWVSPQGNMRSFCLSEHHTQVLEELLSNHYCALYTLAPSSQCSTLWSSFYFSVIVLYLASNSQSLYLSDWSHFSVARVCLMPLLLKVPQIWCIQQTVLSQVTVESC